MPATAPLAPEALATTPGPSAAALAQRLAQEVESAGELQFGDAPKRRWWVPVAIVLALLALVAQVLWYQFDRWALDLRVRPLYAAICSALDCELPVLRDVDAMVAKNLVVRSHPEVAGALLVNAVIVNQAPFAQPFPNLELRFTTLNGTLVAGREFTPGEYLAGELLGAVELARNVPVHVELAIEDPGADAVNYYLSFR